MMNPTADSSGLGGPVDGQGSRLQRGEKSTSTAEGRCERRQAHHYLRIDRWAKYSSQWPYLALRRSSI